MPPFERPSVILRAPILPAKAELWQQNLAVVRRWAVWFSLSVITILLCITFVDQPLARFAHEHPVLSYHGHRLSFIPVVILVGASAAVVLIGSVRALRGEVPLFWRRVLF